MGNASNILDTNGPEYVRAHAHKGDMFSATILENLAATSNKDFLIIGGARHMHLKLSITADGTLDFFGYYGTTYSAAGNPLNIINDNFASSNAPLGTINDGATITDIGTVGYSKLLVGGSGPLAVGGEGGPEKEFILQATGIFAIRLTNNAAQVVRYSLDMAWYEDGYSS